MEELFEEYGTLIIAVIIGSIVLTGLMAMFLTHDGIFSAFVSKFISYL